MSLKSLLVLGALAFVWSFSPTQATAQQRGTVYLNDGSVISGDVLEFVPGDHVTLQVGTGAPSVIPHTLIARVAIGQPAAVDPTLAASLAAPGSAAQSRRPTLGVPAMVLTLGTALVVLGGVLIPVSYDASVDDWNDGVFNLGFTLMISGGMLGFTGLVWLIVRGGKRRLWDAEQRLARPPTMGLTPVIAPGQGLYGLQGVLRF